MIAEATSDADVQRPVSLPGPWRRCTLHTYPEVAPAVRPLLAALADAGYAASELFGLQLALEEALVNAIKHGHDGDPAKQVRLQYHVTEERCIVEVEDEGDGFDPRRVPDPRDPANWEQPSGRGLLLIRHYVTWMQYNDVGNRITLCKERRA